MSLGKKACKHPSNSLRLPPRPALLIHLLFHTDIPPHLRERMANGGPPAAAPEYAPEKKMRPG